MSFSSKLRIHSESKKKREQQEEQLEEEQEEASQKHGTCESTLRDTQGSRITDPRIRDRSQQARSELASLTSLIRNAEKEAYASVMLAFGYQADHLTWEKESLLCELRYVLNIMQEDHSEILTTTRADNTAKDLREVISSAAPPAPN